MKMITFGILLIGVSVKSQDTELSRKIQDNGVKVKIIHIDGKSSRGYAYSLMDDNISIYMPANQPTETFSLLAANSGKFKTIPASDIQTMKFREKNKFQWNVLAGFLLGTLGGILAGHIKENGIAIEVDENIMLDLTHPPEKTNYPKIILSGAAIGTVTGAIIGSFSKKFVLKGKKERFRENHDKMTNYMWMKNPVQTF